MRVTYGRELIIQKYLDNKVFDNLEYKKVKTYVPMCYKITERRGQRRHELVSAVSNLIFLHTIKSDILELKKTDKACLPLRFIIDQGTGQPIIIPDKQMEDFIRITQLPEDRLMYLNITSDFSKKGQKVRIIKGELTGVEGQIVRIQGNKRVVVSLGGLVAVGVTFLPPEFLQKIE